MNPALRVACAYGAASLPVIAARPPRPILGARAWEAFSAGGAMKRWFRLPETDREDELDEPPEPPEPPQLPSPERARGALLFGLGTVIACQILFPVALPFLLMFGATGAAAGALFALQDREAAGVGVVALWFMEHLFDGSRADLGWLVRTTVITGGAVFLGLGVGFLIRRVRAGGDA